MGSPANQAVCCRARWYSETKRCSQAMGRHLPRCSQPVWECRVWTRRTRDKCRDSMYRPYGQERWTWSAQGGGGHTVPGPNLAKGQILANVALCRVCQWQTFVHVQGEGLVRVHVQPLQRRQSTQVRGRQPPLPRGLCEHLLDHQGIDIYQTDLEQVEREHADLLVLPFIAGELAALAIQNEIVGAVPVFHDVEPLVDLTSEGLQPHVIA